MPRPTRHLGPVANSMLLLLALHGSATAGGIWHLGKSATPPSPSAAVKPGAAGEVKDAAAAAAKSDEARAADPVAAQAPAPANAEPPVAAEPASAGKGEQTGETGVATEVAKEVAGEAAKAVVKAASEAGEKEEKPAEKAAASGDGEGNDYYRKRAETILRGEGAYVNGKQHPLAAARPGMDVVVCEAGCRTTAAEIVYAQPTSRRAVATIGELQTTAAGPDAGTAGPQIVCVGGCYEGSRRLYTAPSSASGVGEWTTTTAKAAGTPARAGSGDWMRRIDETKPAPQPVPAPKP